MAMELMLSLAHSRLPTTLDDPADIDKLRILAAAELVHADLPPVSSDVQTAQVYAFTAEGRAALRMTYPNTSFHFSQSALGEHEQPTWDASLDAWHMAREHHPPPRRDS